MSSWLDNLAAQHGEEEDEEEEIIAFQQPPAPVAPTIVVDVANCDNVSVTTQDTEENSMSIDCDDTKSEISVGEERAPRPIFNGQATKAMEKFSKAADKAVKDEEYEYVRAVLNMRKCLNSVLQATSKPIQTIGAVGKLASTAAAKYSTLREKIMSIDTYIAEK